MNLTEFKAKISEIKTATSKTGKKYNSIRVNGNTIVFKRENKTDYEKIYIEELFDFYSNGDINSTPDAKNYISGRVQSPSVAILLELNKMGPIASVKSTQNKTIVEEELVNKSKQDKITGENLFFKVLSKIVGVDYLYSKSINKPITTNLIFFPNNYKDFMFEKNINDCYVKILKHLRSNCNFSSSSLSHHIDGLIYNHPQLGNRIVEFDEEQHFTHARKVTIEHLSQIISNEYLDKYLDMCNDFEYSVCVLKKHRIKNKMDNTPKTFEDFILWLEEVGEKETNYIKRKANFDYLGGRIAQRAYYDTLRDTAHLSNTNNLDSPIRFSKKEFEDTFKMDIDRIDESKMEEYITNELKYKLTSA